MRPCRSSLRFVFVAALVLAASPAFASVGPPVKVRWSGPIPSPAVAGQEFEGAFEIISGKSAAVSDLRVEGSGWSLRSVASPRAMILGPGETLVVPFRAVPSDPASPLVVTLNYDGRPARQSFHLDAESLAKVGRAGGIAFPDGGPRTEGAGAVHPRGGQQLHVFGFFKYIRDNGPSLGGESVTIRLMDADLGPDEEIWSGSTNVDGSFDANVNWDDGSDVPDLYLRIELSGYAVELQHVDVGESMYKWETPEMTDFTGNTINYGLMMPNDPADYGAVHIYTSIVRAHRYGVVHGLMDPPKVDVLWPDNDNPTQYDPADEEIHIAPARTWNELSHSHEYAHHLHNTYGNLLDSDYENGFCDTGGVPGHCVWCPENLSDGWQEGFANWFGMAVTEDYPATYGIQPWVSIPANGEGRYANDGLGLCQDDNQSYPTGITEGFTMAFLRDVFDAANDDHDGGAFDCAFDAMSLGDDEILTVFRDDDPTDVYQFRDRFRIRFPQHDQDLWSTARNATLDFSFPLPAPVVTLSSTSSCNVARVGETIQLAVTANGSLLQLQWRRNGANLANGGGVSGATTRTLTLSPLAASMSGTYECVVKTCDGSLSTTSPSAHVSVVGGATANPLVSWGENGNSQAGDGTTNTPVAPFLHPGIFDFVDVDGGRAVTFAVRANGDVWSWGQEQNGELGDGLPNIESVPSPAQIPGLTGVVQVAASISGGLALKRDGTVVGWGQNFGQIGDGTTDQRWSPTPTQVSGCVLAIEAGDYFGVLLLDDGTVLTAGLNDAGQLGSGAIGGVLRTIYAPVVGLSNVYAIAAQTARAYALKSDGTVWSWGDNVNGQLGNGDVNFADSATPVQVVGLSNIKAISATGNNGFAIATNGTVYAWGNNAFGSIGDGNTLFPFRVSPVVVPALSNPRKIDGGNGGWNMALLQDGTFRAWGLNQNREFGQAAPFSSAVPIPVPGVASATGFGTGYGTIHAFGVLGGVTDVAQLEGIVAPPTTFALHAPAPNPFRGQTAISYDLPEAAAVRLAIYDVTGRAVRTVVDTEKAAGRYNETWNGRDDTGRSVGAGIYFVRLEREGEAAITKRMVRVR